MYGAQDRIRTCIRRVASVRVTIPPPELVIGAPGGIRTPDRRFRRPMLYSTELPGHVARGLGIEPSSPALQAGAELPN